MFRLLITLSVFIAAGSFLFSGEIFGLWMLGVAVLCAVWGRIDHADKHKQELVRAIRDERETARPVAVEPRPADGPAVAAE